ncbi:GntR family transcriptional regulator [Afifella sp. IM 167]|uniref:GntR family transcriptional regulator n=1 Tax=Afifella sp. IM 167 TaxID=2033586 RepID=UPI001CCD3C6E|nr:GntR family transcriptional regulator [Afifella sp. IM 167]MBZ8132389.1 GntR family transcriptional regulator [Afifella sp. IM 167]
MKPPAFGGRTLSDRAFEWLEEAIIKGDYPPETKLDEAELAEAFGISRGPVREAIRRLEGKKLVERVAHVGARVARRSQNDLIDLLYIREALEGMACRLATQRVSEAALDELEKLLEGHAAEEPLQAGAHYYQKPGDYDFHFRIIQESGNERLIEMLCEDLYHLLRVYRYRSSARKGRAIEALKEHRDILAAMRARDADLAERCMRQHLTHARIAAEEMQNNSVRPPRLKTA